MSFSSLLNQYIAQMNCTAKELSEKTGLSTATLSRYRSGERVPNSEQLHKLLTGASACLCEQTESTGRNHPSKQHNPGRHSTADTRRI